MIGTIDHGINRGIISRWVLLRGTFCTPEYLISGFTGNSFDNASQELVCRSKIVRTMQLNWEGLMRL